MAITTSPRAVAVDVEPALVRALAVTAALCLGLRPSPVPGITAGTVMVLLLAPVWYPVAVGYRGARLLFGATALAAFGGVVLTLLAGPARATDRGLLVSGLGLLFTYLFGAGLLLWVRSVVGVAVTGAAFGAGLLLTAGLAMAGQNVWKYYLAVPVAVIVLALLARHPGVGLTLAGLAAIALSGVVADFRSLAGIALLTAALWYWRGRRLTAGAAPVGRWQVLLLVLTGVVAGYFLLTAAMTGGLLGAAIQQRTAAQLSYSSGLLLTGGRPEWAGTLELLRSHPLGFGVGVLPSGDDVATAMAGLMGTGVPTVRGYALHFLFDGGFKLHSVTADLWAGYGLLGVVLAVVLVVLLVRVVVAALSDARGTALALFIALYGLFQMAVGPIWTSMPFLCLALGVGLPAVAGAARTTPATG